MGKAAESAKSVKFLKIHRGKTCLSRVLRLWRFILAQVLTFHELMKNGHFGPTRIDLENSDFSIAKPRFFPPPSRVTKKIIPRRYLYVKNEIAPRFCYPNT